MIVSNSSCLIILDKLGKLEILERLYTTITIPKAVKDEVFKGKTAPDLIEVVEIRQPIASRILEKTLGDGESEAIGLSLELNADLLIIDDLAARKVAKELGIKITGVIGILLEAKKMGFIQDIKDLLDEMIKHDFRISKTVCDETLKIAKEKQRAKDD
jgi:predicted nucleic acid-binding protein